MILPLLLLVWVVGSVLLGLVLGAAIGRADDAQRAADRGIAERRGFKSYNHRELQ